MREKTKTGRIIPFERDVEFFLKRGSTRLDKNDLIEAINNYYIAYEREPDNVDIQLMIAEVLTEMRRYEQSNQLLFPLLAYEQSPAECFFGIACNFLGLQEFHHAHESLESYLTLDPDGEFVEDALDMLDAIEDERIMNSFMGLCNKDEKEAYNDCALGRQYIENGRSEEAVELLEETVRKNPKLHFVRNNLALAYFCHKQFNKAMEIVNSVLEEAPNDIQAHCNLLLFRHATRDTEAAEQTLNFLRNSVTDDPQDWNRMAVVFMEMNQVQEALNILRKLQIIFPYDESTLHRLGVCYYNLGEYKKSVECYDRLIKMDPYDTIAPYYRRLAYIATQGRIEKADWMFNYQVPYVEVLKRVRELNKLNRYPYEQIKLRWHEDREFRSLLMWSIKLPDIDTKRSMLQMVSSFGGCVAEQTLRRFQLDQMQPDSLKREVFIMLKHMGAREPYIAYLHGNLVQSRVQMQTSQINGVRVPMGHQRALEICLRTMQQNGRAKNADTAMMLFRKYIGCSLRLTRLRGTQIQAFAAALDYLSCVKEQESLQVEKAEEIYGVSAVRITNAITKMREVLGKELEI